MAGKSFADKVREAAKDGGAERIRTRINKIKDKAAKNKPDDLEAPPVIDQKKEQQDKRASGQESKWTIEQQNNRTTGQMSGQQNNRAIEQQNKRAGEQEGRGAGEQESNRTTEQMPGQQDNRTIGHMPGQLSTRTTEQMPGQQDNRATEQQNKRAGEQENNKAAEQQSSRTGGQESNRTTEQVGAVDPELKPKDLKLNQYRILYEIYFNRPFKVSGPDRIGSSPEFPIPYGTVRKCLESLYKKGYISEPFSINDGVKKGTTCQVVESKCIPIFGVSRVINSEQVDKRAIGQGSKWTTRQGGNRAKEQEDNRAGGQGDNRTDEQENPSYKLVSKFFKKLTNYIENSQFWKDQGVGVKKCERWATEFYPDDPDALLSQLMFAEYAAEHSSVLQPKNINKTPVDVFYGCLKKGGMTRPAGYEFPAERSVRIRKEEIENQKKMLAEQAAIREQEKAMADELAFNEFLKDKDSISEMIAGMEQKKRFITPKKKISLKLFKESGQIDSKLEHALRIEFNREEGEGN